VISLPGPAAVGWFADVDRDRAGGRRGSRAGRPPGVLIDARPSNAGRSALLGASAASVLGSQPSVLLDDSRSTLNHRRRRR